MEREILFRGKRVDNGEWIEGNYNLLEIGSNLVPIIIPFQNLVKAMMSDVFMYQVDLSTVGQFIGLTDKNGVRIFGGDILKRGSHKYVVKWCEDCAMFLLPCITDKKLESDFTVFYGYDFEIIGNVHDDSEMLKGEPNV